MALTKKWLSLRVEQSLKSIQYLGKSAIPFRRPCQQSDRYRHTSYFHWQLLLHDLLDKT
ncbi:uncharacterized protein MYCGRDRAFT_103019 [Zymoseptoria tritici IPO323]|uniref:Uncharacterized protein n=1 Tax=Zymoseptoria tritici (strain CBS 115943 / IPO323) TaxID=336722 RepID=F9X2J5_ZYMTI|nr:uncharacterized protein MYCGRDRAFT_103019 [Zymoseptoria tritici IPO323]EGP90767.1 hypothetical protein MYCGRDRAFT_103019 [Zymoseptoria tritici IPO323]